MPQLKGVEKVSYSDEWGKNLNHLDIHIWQNFDQRGH